MEIAGDTKMTGPFLDHKRLDGTPVEPILKTGIPESAERPYAKPLVTDLCVLGGEGTR